MQIDKLIAYMHYLLVCGDVYVDTWWCVIYEIMCFMC